MCAVIPKLKVQQRQEKQTDRLHRKYAEIKSLINGLDPARAPLIEL